AGLGESGEQRSVGLQAREKRGPRGILGAESGQQAGGEEESAEEGHGGSFLGHREHGARTQRAQRKGWSVFKIGVCRALCFLCRRSVFSVAKKSSATAEAGPFAEEQAGDEAGVEPDHAEVVAHVVEM